MSLLSVIVAPFSNNHATTVRLPRSFAILAARLLFAVMSTPLLNNNFKISI